MAKKVKLRISAPSWRYVASISILVLVLMCGLFGLQQFERFLIRDPRFVVAPPAEYGEESPNLHVQGVQYASRSQILRVFQPDIGRSLYLLPLADRRRSLTRIGWVKDAAIVRTWPNEVSVQITERRPAAFLELRSEGISRWTLIDSDGVILDPPAKAPFDLPVITGVRSDEALAMRGIRVRRMNRMLDDIGSMRDKVSEVDVADLDDLKVTLKMGSRGVVLMLGDRNFHDRFQHFLDHYDQMQQHLPNATIFDLRLDQRITVLGGQS